MGNVNKEFYNAKYADENEYKYKTNTRYQRYLVTLMNQFIDCDEIKTVLDIGCGEGLNTFFFTEDYPNAEIIGMDLSDVGIAKGNEKYKNVKNLKFECKDVSTLRPEHGEVFSLVCAFELLEHIEDWEKLATVMTEISDKYILISAPIGKMRDYEKAHGHYRNFQRGELESFFNAKGFKKVKTLYAGFPWWSPITRSLLAFKGGQPVAPGAKLSGIGKIASLILYFLYRYMSTKNKYGDQFVGLFEKSVNE